MNVKFLNICWDTDGYGPDLPTEVTLSVADDVDVATDGADILSDQFGYCVIGFDYEMARN